MNSHPHSSPPLYVQARGPADAPAIVFLHGGGAGLWMWEPVIRHLPDYHCLAPDLPEHGRSRAVRPFSMELAAAKTAEIIREQASGGKATVVGLSEGAQVAVQLLATEPGLVDKAVLSSALVRPIPWITRMLTPGVLRWTYRLGMAPFKKNEAWIRLNRKYAAGVPEQYHAQFRQSFQEMDESGFTNLMLANLRFRLPAGLEKAAAPCLVIVGSREYEAMKQSARDLAARLPDATVVQVSLGKGATLAEEHNWALNAPGLFAETVRAWIEEKTLPPGLAA